MWMRQEYKPEKARFQNPYELDLENLKQEDSGTCITALKEEKNGFRAQNIKLEQSYAAIGTTVWDGSIALAKMFDSKSMFDRVDLQECKVIELGAGCGLVGIYLSLLGAKRTILTDQSCCIPTLRRNIQHNVAKEMQSTITAKEYSWGDSVEDVTREGAFDLVVAAEVLYCEEDSVKLAKCIPSLTHSKSLVFVSMGRNRGGENAFVKTMKSQGFEIQEVKEEELHPKYQDSIIKVLKAYKT